MPIELNDLHAFLIVADELHFGRAAARLNVTASPLTRRIQRIERALAVRLFERSRRGVSMTPAGLALQAEARTTLERLGSLPDRLARIAQGETGQLRIGVIGIGIARAARDIHRRLRDDMPEVRLTWQVASSSRQIALVRQGLLDAGLVHTPIEHDGLATRRLVRESLMVALPAGHPLARQPVLGLGDLRRETFLIGSREQSPADFDRLISGCNAAGFSPRLDVQSQSLASFIALVAIGAGVAIAPASLAQQALDGVTFVPIEGHGQFSEISLAWDPERVSPALHRLLRWPGTALLPIKATKRKK